ncbi:MAG: HAD hydrolase family protein [Clostridia bacterium]|nr:HAD hydrolase family protein [Clostridia bacterium]
MNAIFFDIDGTLDDFEGRIPASTVYAVRKARANGALCFVNTGRPYFHILPEIKALGFDGFVCSCGQHLLIGERTVKRVRPTAEASRRTIELAERCFLDGYFESEEGCLVSFVHDLIPLVAFQIKDFSKRGVPVLLGYEHKDFRLDKFCFFAGEGSDPDLFIEGVKDIFTVIKKGEGDYEMVMNGCTKANGIGEILGLMGVKDAETYAIGDSANDLLMLGAVDHPIAMGGAPKELTDTAEFTTDRLENDGLKKALEHFGII